MDLKQDAVGGVCWGEVEELQELLQTPQSEDQQDQTLHFFVLLVS